MLSQTHCPVTRLVPLASIAASSASFRRKQESRDARFSVPAAPVTKGGLDTGMRRNDEDAKATVSTVSGGSGGTRTDSRAADIHNPIALWYNRHDCWNLKYDV